MFETQNMADSIYHIKIKKEYASAIIEDLQQADAIEIVEESIPEWQKKESLKRLEEMKNNPSAAMPEEEFFKLLKIQMKKYKILFSLAALNDLKEAKRWYNTQ